MDDDEQRPAGKHPISIAKLSKTPSWIMLGFVLGALFVVALPPLRENPPRPPPRRAVIEKPKPPAPPQIATIQAVFEDPQWQRFAVWAEDTTEVALWNNDTREFSDFFEVRRFAGVNYFRSLPALTRPLIQHRTPPPPDCPLRFTAPVAEIARESRPAPIERPLRPSPSAQPQMAPPVMQPPHRIAPPALPTIETTTQSPPAPRK